MKKSSVEISVGIFVIIGILCAGYLSIKLGKMEWIGGNDYALYARFESVSGLKAGAEVQMAGVPVGKVHSVSLDLEDKVALVEIKVNNEIKLADDVIASVKTAGLIGDKYIKLSAGGSDEFLSPGDSIDETESALDIEELVSKYVFGGV
ncbi:outer membrane lipid asymmetry maintenance protein MlaD [Desulfonema magnum]|uniref:Intermembrane phospholipid transport system binding protein n=1 Tax=Desulfonema magnum TaxID=45655 RepID=A0A975BPE7_9BACT|nr:outer membrane lipid asymmetry maintenance protein MlaD [Desulfonema magnum]QTA88923.1 Intermembrane phospholipid transport system binding protein [Desulfonema magnum]